MDVKNPSNRNLQNRRRIASKILAAIFGAVAGVFLILVVLPRFGSSSMPVITRDILAAARETWKTADVKSYAIEINVTGRQAAVYRVEVRDGEVTSATRNDQPLTNRRTFGTWSVPGMFHTISADLTNIEKFEKGTADPFVPQVRVRGRFHPQFGYPERFHRVELRKFGANPEVTWKVMQFETIP